MLAALAFIFGLLFLVALLAIPDEPRERLFYLNVFLGSALVILSLGGVLVYHAATALGGSPSAALRPRRLAPLLIAGAVAYPALVALGQWQINDPERLPWLFPVVNVLAVSVPSLAVATVVAWQYRRANPLAWPVSWREWTSGFIYGALAATNLAGIVNSIILAILAVVLVNAKGEGSALEFQNSLRTLPTGWGIFFNLFVLCVIAPIDEEILKGLIVAFFFYRRGRAGRCFLWGALSGAGFNLLETFTNSLSVVNPDVLRDEFVSNDWWWQFAIPRAGTALLHATATGFSALGFYGLFRHKGRLALFLPAGMLTHASWNFLAYVLGGDAFFGGAGPDSALLDVIAITGMFIVAAFCAAVLAFLPLGLKDDQPAPIYVALGMVPARGDPGGIAVPTLAGGAGVAPAPPAAYAPEQGKRREW